MPLLRILTITGMAAQGVAAIAAAQCEAAVVFRSGSAAYEEAVVGIRATLTDTPCRIRYIDLAKLPEEKWRPDPFAPPRLVAAIGIGAYEQLRIDSPGLNVLPVLVLRSDLGTAGSPRRGGAVYADVPLITILEHLRVLFPKNSRIGLIHRPAFPAPDTTAKDRVRQLGYELRIVDCAGPEKLLAAFSSLKGSVDFVIAEPDTELYNSTTVKPLVLASLDQRLPLVGFSSSFVRAGALVGVYPDFLEAGRQTGELMNQILLGRNQGLEENVHKVRLAVNQQIGRLLGIEPAVKQGLEILK